MSREKMRWNAGVDAVGASIFAEGDRQTVTTSAGSNRWGLANRDGARCSRDGFVLRRSDDAYFLQCFREHSAFDARFKPQFHGFPQRVLGAILGVRLTQYIDPRAPSNARAIVTPVPSLQPETIRFHLSHVQPHRRSRRTPTLYSSYPDRVSSRRGSLGPRLDRRRSQAGWCRCHAKTLSADRDPADPLPVLGSVVFSDRGTARSVLGIGTPCLLSLASEFGTALVAVLCTGLVARA